MVLSQASTLTSAEAMISNWSTGAYPCYLRAKVGYNPGQVDGNVCVFTVWGDCKHTQHNTNLLRCKWQTACPAFLCPGSGSAAPGWTDRTSCPSPSFHLSPCLFLCLALFPVHRSVAAGAEPRPGAPWQSQQQPGDREQRETGIKLLQGKICLIQMLSEKGF